MAKINKKILAGALVAILILIGIFVLVFQKKIKVPQEGEIKKEETTEDILERLTPKEAKPMTEEEKKETEEILKNLTPENPKPKTPEEIREEEELLKKLTP